MKALVSIIVALPLAAAAAGTITVNTTADNTAAGDGYCTLREAIANVNAAADTTGGDCGAGTDTGDTITFNLALPATIRVAHGGLAVGQDVAIVGPVPGSPMSLRLDARNTGRVFEITAGTTKAANLTIQHGSTNHFGGGVLIAPGAGLELVDCRLYDNEAAAGGAIENYGTATLTHCTLYRNKALYVKDKTYTGIPDNGFGAGIVNDNGTLILTRCTLYRNRGYDGGGIVNYHGTVTLTNSLLYRNGANRGGGIYNDSGAVTLTNVTLHRNGNITKRGSGGGIFNHFGDVTATNTIISNSLHGNCTADAIDSGGYNLSSDSTCFTSDDTDLVNADPMLASLGSLGGLTQTLALCTAAGVPKISCRGASPAIDAGDDAVTGPPSNLSTDQRGLPRQAGEHVDIGAYEVQ